MDMSKHSIVSAEHLSKAAYKARNTEIQEAKKTGASHAEIARASGLTRAAVQSVLRRS